jgi:hypothetical protein
MRGHSTFRGSKPDYSANKAEIFEGEAFLKTEIKFENESDSLPNPSTLPSDELFYLCSKNKRPSVFI